MDLQELNGYIKKDFDFLFNNYQFSTKYSIERAKPFHIRVGLESLKYPIIKILFIHEWATSVMLGYKDAEFEKDLGWISQKRLVDFILKRKLRWPPDKVEMPYKEYILKDLSQSAMELEEYCEIIFRMFADTKTIEQWKPDFEKYVKMEIYDKLKLTNSK